MSNNLEKGTNLFLLRSKHACSSNGDGSLIDTAIIAGQSPGLHPGIELALVALSRAITRGGPLRHSLLPGLKMPLRSRSRLCLHVAGYAGRGSGTLILFHKDQLHTARGRSRRHLDPRSGVCPSRTAHRSVPNTKFVLT